MEDIEKHIIHSGKYAELSETLREKLQKSGWYDNALAFVSRELSVVENPRANSEELKQLHSQAMAMIPDSVKNEMMLAIRSLVDDMVEKA